MNCEKAFSQLSNLQSHSRSHQADKPFKCNSCYKCFLDEASLLDHIPKHKESKHLKVGNPLRGTFMSQCERGLEGSHLHLLRQVLHPITLPGQAHDETRGEGPTGQCLL